ncbi:hypothetical protein [Aliivibrio fischeri]|uniref:hypothetical protein n=1 Tax=Aliivibrio fischeri TaxID=668 RepID=UPI00080EAC91|nr:hypothetical protein [Aliivibrio fischeri]MCE7556381.1 hypothetical protein [Aliivibrio fischeri]MCE7563054.1 hypothetical protein [Aliivibrio fischeri]MCE7571346.1 hypothetical protein [Aliivibrio fischeri]OCH05886.1 hypothetical protein A6E10_07420 [Aliivibrio fischeri]OCH27452.1 hypothetical protein A6E13_06815 [Aliivibrio fischeri]
MNFLMGIFGKSLWEIVKGIFLQITWQVIVERFATRMVVWGLEKLKTLTTNDVMQNTVDDVLLSLQGKRLKEVPVIKKE